MNNPFISICIPTYNGEKFLHECINSAINQSYHYIEIIIVDDGSTDKTYDIIGDYAAKDSRIKIFRNEKNLGLVGNWNRCMELSSGGWIKFLFQDDYFGLDCIETMVNAISTDDKIIASQRCFVSDDLGKEPSIDNIITFQKLGVISPVPVHLTPQKIALFTVQHICLNFIGEPTVVMFKKDVISELGTFNPDLIQICDLEYFLRIASNYGLKYIPQQLTYFRLHKDSTSASNISKRFFLINNTDPLIVVHQLLYGRLFNLFRSNLGILQKIRIKLFFSIRAYEACRIAMHSTTENRSIFDSLTNKYPFIYRFSKGNIITYILLKITTVRRSIRKGKNL